MKTMEKSTKSTFEVRTPNAEKIAVYIAEISGETQFRLKNKGTHTEVTVHGHHKAVAQVKQHLQNTAMAPAA